MKKKVIFSLIVVLLGVGLVFAGSILETRERKAQLGPQLYNNALKAYQAKNFEEAVALFIQAEMSTKNTELEAKAFYNLATLNWAAQMGDADTIINSYQASLRKDPEFYEAGFNLELFYEFLRQAEAEMVPVAPGEGEGEGDTTGDI